MCCDPRFSLLPTPTPTPTPSPFLLSPKPRVSLTTTFSRLNSFKTCATINDGYVGAAPPLLTDDDLSFYDLLGISETVNFGEIKQAYKQLARKYHPDVSPPGRVEEYTQRFIRVQEAYETLSDPNRRALYDRDMAMGLHLAFSARNQFHEEMKGKGDWKSRWQSQLSQLKIRSMYKETSNNNMSWGARMRGQRNETST